VGRKRETQRSKNESRGKEEIASQKQQAAPHRVKEEGMKKIGSEALLEKCLQSLGQEPGEKNRQVTGEGKEGDG